MAQTNIISNIRGYFDVREYSEKPREQRTIKSNDSTITFAVKYDSLPEQFSTFAKAYTTKDGKTAYMVKFKVSNNCRWYDKTKTQVAKPDNTYLDGKKFELVINYATLPADPRKPQKASGYWCNAIMYQEVDADPFAGVNAFEAAPSAEPQPQKAEEPAWMPTPPPAESFDDTDDIPF